MNSRLIGAYVLGILTCLPGCWFGSDNEVVIYCALDREFSEPILVDYAQQQGIKILPRFDAESTKTVALAEALIQERNRPRCDLFWNNEILHTLRLEQEGLLESFECEAAAAFPTSYRSPDRNWYGFAARARILIVNTDLLPDPQTWPRSVRALADPKWKGQAAMAKPLFGTTATHAAVLFDRWGSEAANEFFRQVMQTTTILSGNKQVATAVARGQYAFGITDTDDAIIEIDKGGPVKIVYPDQAEGGMGTLFIPNTLCVIKGGPNTERAKQLVEYLLSAEVEKRLALGASAQFPINPAVQLQPRVSPENEVRWMEVDFASAAATWKTSSRQLRSLLHQAP